MRVAFVTRQLATDGQSGIVTATRDLARELAAHGHRVHVLTEGAREPSHGVAAHAVAVPTRLDDLDDACVHDVPGGSRLERAIAVHAALAELHEAGELDVACVPLWGCEGLLAVHDARFPTIVSCMTSAVIHGQLNPDWAASEDGREMLALENAYLQAAQHLHGLTREALGQALARRATPPVTSAVVARGLRDRTTELPAIPGDDPERVALPADSGDGSAGSSQTVELLFVGRRERRKGLDVLLEATTTIIGEGRDVRLTLAGPRREPSDPVSERIRFLGRVSDERRGELYASCDLVCQPSRYESHGIVLVEAMMFGKPIVTTHTGGIPEVVEPGGNALLAAPGDATSLADALRRIVADAGRRREMGARSRALYLERFEIGKITQAMHDLFAEAIDAHSAVSGARR